MTDLDPLNEFLDGDAPDDIDLSGVPREELAKHLIVAGVASHLLAESNASTDDAVRANMVAVLEDARLTRRRRVQRQWFAGIAAAAAVIIATLVYFARPPGDQPLPLLEKIRRFVDDDLDREYEVRAEASKLGLAMMFAESMRMSLHVRGEDHYAAELKFDILRIQTLSIWMGSNGEQHWLVPPVLEFLRLPVLVSDESLNSSWQAGELGMVEQFARRLVRAESAMSLFRLLRNLEADYRVEASAESVQSALPEGQIEIVAYRHPQSDITIPDVIRVVADEKTGVVRRVALKFADLPSSMGIENPFKLIRYTLVTETANRGAVYDHESHHDEDREVLVR
jgi:hypothetical protein